MNTLIIKAKHLRLLLIVCIVVAVVVDDDDDNIIVILLMFPVRILFSTFYFGLLLFYPNIYEFRWNCK